MNFIFKATKYIFKRIFRPIKFIIFFIKYKINNRHNLTMPKYPPSSIDFFNLKSVKVWRYTYWILDVHMRWRKWEELIIGDYCSIAYDVTFILWGNHSYKTLLTFPLGIHNNIPWAEEKEAYTNGKIEVGDDVWIWTWAKIMSWVTIGQWAIIAAYAVVTKSVPPYAIVWWVPAKVISYRFSEEIIEKLIKIDFKKIPISKLLKNYDYISKEWFNVNKIFDLLQIKPQI